MIGRPLHELTEADLSALVSQGREEGPQLDFKPDLPKDDHDGRKALYGDIVALANTSGSDLVYGIEDDD